MRAVLVQNIRCAMEKFGKDRVRSDAPEPVTCVSGIGFDAVNDAVPITTLRGGYLLCDGMGLFPVSQAQQETGERGWGMPRVREELRR